MSIVDLYESSEHRNNLAHFAAIVNLANADGNFNSDEEQIVKKFAHRLGITNEEYVQIVENHKKYPLIPPVKSEVRLERIYDFFKIMAADHNLDEKQLQLIERYAVGLGYPDTQARTIIDKSMKLFGGKIDFDDYAFLITKR
ncbi:MAG: TerB family tellurite resistance protein [Flavobacteriales bacterium]